MSCNVKKMSTEELKVLAMQLLEEMQHRNMDELAHTDTLEVIQDTRNGAIVRKADGTPVDRDGWFYMPFMREFSKLFQPTRVNGTSVYRDRFPAGEVLQITSPDGSNVKVIVGGSMNKVTMKGAQISGQFTVVQQASFKTQLAA